MNKLTRNEGQLDPAPRWDPLLRVHVGLSGGAILVST